MIEGMGVQCKPQQQSSHFHQVAEMLIRYTTGAGTFLGLLGFCLVPLPVIFYLKGAKIRERSHFAPTFPMVNQANAVPMEHDPEKDE